jgi:hypothetical protein
MTAKKPKDDQEWVIEKAVESDLRVKRLQAENERLSKLLGLVESYHAAAGEAPKWMPTSGKIRVGAATACLHFSDLHLDEVVDPSQVGGLNAYNREIAEMRLKRWANKACEMGDRYRHKWDGALLLWDGDMVSGAIHEELRETNADYLPGTMVHWAPRIASAIRQIADFYGRVHIPSVVGNHGRLTIKKQAKGRGRNSWDWLLCQMVRTHLKDDSRITWELADGSYLFVPIYNQHIYLTHGDEVGGGSGWAGVWSPLGTIHRRGIEMGLPHGIQPAYSVIGHWHQLVSAHARGMACNGAMKGWDEFAASLRFKPEPAMQGWWVHTPEHGVTLAAPLLLEDRKAEGW